MMTTTTSSRGRDLLSRRCDRRPEADRPGRRPQGFQASSVSLRRNPLVGPMLGGELVGYRKLVVGRKTWRIVYRVLDEGRTVEICEIWAVGLRSDREVYEEAAARVRAAARERPVLLTFADVVTRLGRLAGGVEPPEHPRRSRCRIGWPSASSTPPGCRRSGWPPSTPSRPSTPGRTSLPAAERSEPPGPGSPRRSGRCPVAEVRRGRAAPGVDLRKRSRRPCRCRRMPFDGGM